MIWWYAMIICQMKSQNNLVCFTFYINFFSNDLKWVWSHLIGKNLYLNQFQKPNKTTTAIMTKLKDEEEDKFAIFALPPSQEPLYIPTAAAAQPQQREPSRLLYHHTTHRWHPKIEELFTDLTNEHLDTKSNLLQTSTQQELNLSLTPFKRQLISTVQTKLNHKHHLWGWQQWCLYHLLNISSTAAPTHQPNNPQTNKAHLNIK